MREIRFRAWDEDNKRMLIVGAIDFDGEGGIASINYPQGKVYPNDEFGDHIRLIEYTGLKDKNGVEIYEGDVVRILYTDWPSKSEADPRSLEMYLRDLAYVGAIVSNPYYGWRVEDVGGVNHGEHGYIEVIGNIYENHDLLEKSHAA